jgi:hypothetical protein
LEGNFVFLKNHWFPRLLCRVTPCCQGITAWTSGSALGAHTVIPWEQGPTLYFYTRVQDQSIYNGSSLVFCLKTLVKNKFPKDFLGCPAPSPAVEPPDNAVAVRISILFNTKYPCSSFVYQTSSGLRWLSSLRRAQFLMGIRILISLPVKPKCGSAWGYSIFLNLLPPGT